MAKYEAPCTSVFKKKIKMLKTAFVAAQREFLQMAPQ